MGRTTTALPFAAALASSATQIIVPPGIYLVDNVILPAGKRLEGAGPGQTTLKIVSGSTNNLVSASAADSVAVIGMTPIAPDAAPPPGKVRKVSTGCPFRNAPTPSSSMSASRTRPRMGSTS